MKERPILFNGEMVRAILEGRKTQTRRAIKLPVEFSGSQSLAPRPCPYGKIGDRLWVKETYRLSNANDCACYDPCNCRVGIPIYRATANMEREKGDAPWKPSIFMPRKYSRITLGIEAVRIARLHSITDEEARAEGCCGVASTRFGLPNFRWVWESINGAESWRANPWVWVVSFRRIV